MAPMTAGTGALLLGPGLVGTGAAVAAFRGRCGNAGLAEEDFGFGVAVRGDQL